jgi:hypothetical protein
MNESWTPESLIRLPIRLGDDCLLRPCQTTASVTGRTEHIAPCSGTQRLPSLVLGCQSRAFCGWLMTINAFSYLSYDAKPIRISRPQTVRASHDVSYASYTHEMGTAIRSSKACRPSPTVQMLLYHLAQSQRWSEDHR